MNRTTGAFEVFRPSHLFSGILAAAPAQGGQPESVDPPHRPEMPASYRFGSQWRFELQCTNRKLLNEGVAVPLGSRAFDVLLTLVEAGGELVTKDQLLQRAWPGLVVEEANVYVTVSQLRKVLGVDAVSTVGGIGYRMALPVQAVGSEIPHHNLPAERTEFIGRQAAISEAQKHLQKTRLLTLIGIGGCGKTRLALKLAEFALADHRHGAHWVDLAQLANADHVGLTLALALGCKPDGTTSALTTLTAFCRDLDVLLVLDNCEHLLDSVAQAADVLLTAAPGLRIVATSRVALGLPGEVVYPVMPLELPATGASVRSILQSEAVRLFVDRACSVAPAMEIGDELAQVIAQICRRLDGLPLAIELAAARMRLLSAPQLLGLLDERFSFLTGGDRSLPRQQTLQAMIQWSYEAVSPEAKRAMRAMSVCAGACDLDCVVALLGEPGRRAAVMDCLIRLLDKGLITVRHRGNSAHYAMLDTVRQFALERLDECGEAKAVRDRHRGHFLQLVEDMRRQSALHLPGHWIERLELEHENLLRALEWCLVCDDTADMGLRFVVAMRGYWSARGLLRIGHDLTVRALAHPGAMERSVLRAQALTMLAQLCWWLGEPAAALAHGQEGLAIADELGDTHLMGWAMLALSYVHGALGDPVAAGRLAQDALRLARSAEDDPQISDALVAVADSCFESGELPRAEALYVEAMALREQLALPVRQGLVAISLSEVAMAQGQTQSARHWLRKAGALARETHSTYIGQHVIEKCAALAGDTGDWPLCIRWFSASVRQRQSTGLSDQTMSRKQRSAALDRAIASIGADAAAEAERKGSALGYAQTLDEVRNWLE
jgi:predicted ATPase